MTDFPRGWTLSNENTGAAATITVPATPGVVHVLDNFTARALNQSAGLVVLRVNVTAPAIELTALFPPATTGTDADSESGLDIATAPGAALTVAFTTGPASVTEFLLIQGHDI